MRILKTLFHMVIPTILFYVFYHLLGMLPAVCISLAYSILSALYSYRKEKTVSNSRIIGILGGALSAVSIAFTGNEKLYFVPALIQNVIFFLFFLWLTIRRKSVLHFMAKDFQIRSLQDTPEEKMMPVNLLWIVFFILKIITKILGIVILDFEDAYWLVFLMGDPAMIVVVGLSIVLIRQRMKKSY